ncbi:MAG: cytochrome c [Alphaproteobacteria bacterium]|nr:cytochrome c [Rhodospirillales bacterium]MCW9045617.1 cytochrome c [Alphaproteobacteria bacterium]
MARQFDDLEADEPTPGQKVSQKLLTENKKKRKRGLIAGGITLICVIGLGFSLSIVKTEKEKKLKNRHKVGPLATGKDVYNAYCAYCHGFKLDGKSEWFRRTEKDPEHSPAMNETGNAWRLSDKMLFDISKYGGQPYALPGIKSEMPAFEGVIDDKQINMSLDYIKSQWPEKIRKHQQKITKQKS